MRKLRLLWIVFKRSDAWMMFVLFMGIFFVCGILLVIYEPGIDRYMDALWFLWAVSTTVGLGDYSCVTFVGRSVTILCSLCAMMATAVCTGLIVDFFGELRHQQNEQSLSEFLDKLENLPNLGKEELENISKRVRALRR